MRAITTDTYLILSRMKSVHAPTYYHSLHVSAYAASLCDYYHDVNKDDVALGGLLHDVGKIYIPYEILTKRGVLSEEEFSEIKKHPLYGYSLLEYEVPTQTAECILYHHEKPNGRGYPFGLCDIPLSAQIIAICDQYAALTEDREYKKALPKEEALFILHNNISAAGFLDTLYQNFVSSLG